MQEEMKKQMKKKREQRKQMSPHRRKKGDNSRSQLVETGLQVASQDIEGSHLISRSPSERHTAVRADAYTI